MKLIVGLGNPGDKYEHTRHNVGQMVVDSLVGEDVSAILYKPRSFMNLSGHEVVEKLRFHKLNPDELLIVHDELDLSFGDIKLQSGVSSAGHHGVDSVIQELGTNAFWRLRVGIGPRGEVPGDKFVLQCFTEDEKNKLNDYILPKSQEVIIDWLNKK